MLPYWNVPMLISNARSQKVLGMRYRDVTVSVTEMADQMIDFGMIKDKRKGKK